MARTKQNQRSANRGTVPMGATGGRTPPSKMTVALLATSILSSIWAAAMLTAPGRIAYVYIFAYSEFYMGVLALVSLSITVMLGVVATDRLILSVRQRVLMQSAHRTTGVIAVGSLAVHLVTKMSLGHIGIIDLFIPFLNANQTFYVGLGTVSGLTMTSVLWTGLIRAKFAGRGKPWMWRSLHSIAYLSWPIAIVHGLSAGRAAKTFVYVGYILCVLFVLVYLAVRFSVSLNRKKDFSSTVTGAMKPVGSLVPTTAPKLKDRPKRRSERSVDPMAARVVADRANAPVAVLDTWVPAAPVSAGPSAPVSARPSAGPSAPVSARPSAPVSAAPVSAMPVSSRPVSARPVSARPAASPVSGRPYEDDSYGVEGRPRRYADAVEPAPRSRRGRPLDDERYDDDERFDEAPRPRSRRYADEEPEPRRSRRYADDERFDEATRPMSRRALEDGARRYAEADEPPVPRSRRAAVAEESYDEAPRPRSRPYVEDDEPVLPRSRRERAAELDGRDRFVEEVRPAPRSRHYVADDVAAGRQRYPADERYDDVPRPRPPRFADDEPAPRPRRDRPADVDRADSGRHSRADFAAPVDPWQAGADANVAYLPPDDTPTLIDMASRRARRAAPDTSRGASRGARRKGRDDDAADDMYWRQLRGEAN